MSDHSHANFSRSSGTSWRGLLVTVVIIVAIAGFIALLGSTGDDPSSENNITPAEQSPVSPTE